MLSYSEHTEEVLCGLLSEEETQVLEKFSKDIEKEIRLLEKESVLEQEELEDDMIILNLMKRHAQRDDIFPNEEDPPEKEELEYDEDTNKIDDEKIDSTTKIYLKKIKSGFIPWLKKT